MSCLSQLEWVFYYFQQETLKLNGHRVSQAMDLMKAEWSPQSRMGSETVTKMGDQALGSTYPLLSVKTHRQAPLKLSFSILDVPGTRSAQDSCSSSQGT